MPIHSSDGANGCIGSWKISIPPDVTSWLMIDGLKGFNPYNPSEKLRMTMGGGVYFQRFGQYIRKKRPSCSLVAVGTRP